MYAALKARKEALEKKHAEKQKAFRELCLRVSAFF